MKLKYHQVLKFIYEAEEVPIRNLCSWMKRKHNDHRDFYGLSALLQDGYIGFTGPIEDDIYSQACIFQCYSQPKDKPKYKQVTLLGENENTHANIYISSKCIEYFYQRSEMRKGWYVAAILAVIASIISGVVVSELTTEKSVQKSKSAITSVSNSFRPQAASTGRAFQRAV